MFDILNREAPKPFIEPNPQQSKQNHHEEPKPKQPSVVAQKENTPKATKNETSVSTERAKAEPAPKPATSTVAEPKLSESPKGDWKATLKEYNLQEQAAIESSFISRILYLIFFLLKLNIS